MLSKLFQAATLVAILLTASASLFAQAATTTVSDSFVGPDGAPVQVKMTITPNQTFTSPDGYVVPVFSSAAVNSKGAFSVNLIPNTGTTPAGSSYRVDYTLNGIPFHETWVVPHSTAPLKLGAVRTLLPPPLSSITPAAAPGDLYSISSSMQLARVPANSSPSTMFLSQSSSAVPSWVQPSFAHLSGTLTDTQLANSYSGVGSCTNKAVTALTRNGLPSCTTITADYVDSSVAKTGADLNTSSQVASTHISGATGNALPLFTSTGGLNNSSLSQDASGNLSSAQNLYVGGLTPWADIHTYGSRGVLFAGSTPATKTTTGTISAGSTSLTLGADLSWKVGDGIVIPSAGPAPAISAVPYIGAAICTRTGSGSTPFYDASAVCTYSPAAQYSSFAYTMKVNVKDSAGGQPGATSLSFNGPPVLTQGLGRLLLNPLPASGLTLNLGTYGFGSMYAFCSKNTAWVNYGQLTSTTLTDNATNYVYLDANQNNCPITTSTSGYPANNLYYAIARVTTSGGKIGNVIDDRVEAWAMLYAPPVSGAEAYQIYLSSYGAETWGGGGTAGWYPYWTSGTYTRGQVVQPNPMNGHFYINTTPGANSTGASQPSFCTSTDCTTTDGSITWQEITSDGMAFAFVGALPGVCDTCSSTGSNDWLMTRVDAITDSTHVTLHDVATTAVTNKAGARHDDTAAFNACLLAAARSGGTVAGSMAEGGTCYARGNFWVSGLTFPQATPSNTGLIRLLLDGSLTTSRTLVLPYAGAEIEGVGGATLGSFVKPPVAGIGVSGMISPLVKVSQGFATLKNVQMLYGNGCILTLANHLTLENSACNAAQSQTTLPVLEFDGSYGNLIRRSVISSSGQTLPPAIYFTRGLYGATDFGITHVEDSYLVGGNFLAVNNGVSTNTSGQFYLRNIITENLVAPLFQADISGGATVSGVSLRDISMNDAAAAMQASVLGTVASGTIGGSGGGRIAGLVLDNVNATQFLDCSTPNSISGVNILSGISSIALASTSNCGNVFGSMTSEHFANFLDIGNDYNNAQFPIAPSPLGCTYSAPTATCTTTKPMAITTGESVAVSGVTDGGYNGMASNVSMVGTAPYYQIQFTPAGAPAGPGGGGIIIPRNLKRITMGSGASGNTLQVLASDVTTPIWKLSEKGLMSIADPLSTNFLNFQGAPLTANRTFTLPDISGTLPLISGAITTGNCTKWISATQLGDGGVCGGSALTSYVVQSGGVNSGELNSAQNAINLSEFILPLTISFSKMLFSVAVADGSNNSDIGIVDASGSLKCDVGAQTFGTTGTKDLSCTQGSVTLQPGRYYFAFTTAAATPTLKVRFSTMASGFFWIGHSNVSSTTSSGGALPPTVAINTGGAILNASAYGYPAFAMH